MVYLIGWCDMGKIIVFLLLAFAVLSFGCIQQPSGPQYVCADGRTIVSSISLCPTAAAATPAPAAAAPTAAPVIALETELEVCSGMPEMQGNSLEELCVSGLAAKRADASLCKKLSYDGKRTCYLLVAQVTGNASVCAEAGAEKSNCYSEYAANANDASICEKITEIGGKDNCYSKLAMSLGDSALCEKIKSVSQKNGCYFDMAMRLQDTAYCNKIMESSQQENCLQNLQQRGQPATPGMK